MSLTVAADWHPKHMAGTQRSDYSSEVGLLRLPQTCPNNIHAKPEQALQQTPH